MPAAALVRLSRTVPKPVSFAQKKKAALANLELTIKLIKRYGWIQGEEGDRDQGFCLIGAAQEADGWGEALAWRALEDIVQNDARRGKIDLSIDNDPVAFNDDQGTEKRHVLKLLRRGIKAITECKEMVNSGGLRFKIKLPPVPKEEDDY